MEKHSEIVRDSDLERQKESYLAIPKHWVRVMERSKKKDLS
jgi:hypothetical protein